MNRFSRILYAGVALAITASIALAANTTFFTSIGDLVFPFKPPIADGSGGSIGDQTRGGMAPVNGTDSFLKATGATSLFSYTFGNFQAEILLRPAGTIAYGYVTFAPDPIAGSRQCVFSTQIVTTFYLAANAGQTLNDAVTTLAANGRVCYTYSRTNLTWDRSS